MTRAFLFTTVLVPLLVAASVASAEPPQAQAGQPVPIPAPAPQPTPAPANGQLVIVEQPTYGPPAAAPGYQPNANPALDREEIYRRARKRVWLAVMLDAIVPGVGNIYADAFPYSLVTWGALLGGIVLFVAGTGGDSENAWISLGGGLLIIGGYLFGVITAGINAADYNAELEEQLGLTAWLAPTPDGAGGAGGLALRL